MGSDLRPVSGLDPTAPGRVPDLQRTDARPLELALPILGPMHMAQAPLPSPPLADLAESYLLHLRASRRSAGTIVMYRRILGRFERFLAALLGSAPSADALTRDAARRYLVHLQQQPRYVDMPDRRGGRLAPATLNQHARALRAFARWLWDEGFTAEHRLDRLRMPKVPLSDIEPLTPAEVERLLAVFDPRNAYDRRTAAMVGLLVDTGMRTGELSALRTADVNLHIGELRVVGKGEKARVVVAGRRALSLLRRYLHHRPPGLGQASDRLFVTTSGRALDPHQIGHIVRRLRRRSGIPRLYAHLLRHTFAVHFLRNGGNPLTLQRLLGHASLATTNRYVTLATGDLVAAHRQSSPLDNL